ncbi:GIY-YIG nuclease family protein [Pseudomonas aeruginosa]
MSHSVSAGNWTCKGPAIQGYSRLSGLSQRMFSDFQEMVDLESRAENGERLYLTPKQKMRMVRAIRATTNIYFIFAPQHSLIKIGQALDVNKRLSSLRSGSPATLTLLACVRFFGDLETFLHINLDQYRSHGEWFRAEGAVLDVVEAAQDYGVDGIMKSLRVDIASLPA